MSYFADIKTFERNSYLLQARQKPQVSEVGVVNNIAWLNRYGGWDENPDAVIASKGMSFLKEIERDTHLSSCYRTRRQKLISKGWHIAAARSDKDEYIADFVRYNLSTFLAQRSRNGFDGDILGMMDSIAKGFSLSEIVWKQITGGKYDGYWGIEAVRKKDAEDYGFKTDKFGNVVADGVIYHGDYVGEPKRLKYNKFIHVIYGPDDENPYGNSSTTKVAFWTWLKKNNAKFWAIFGEKFSMPITVAKIPKGMYDTDKKAKLESFLKNLQSESGIILPDGFVLEFLEATRRGDVTYDNFIERCNKEISKEVLGATMAIEEGSKGQGSYAHASVNAEILEVYTFFDAIMIAQCVNNQLIRRLIDYNFIGVEEYPVFSFKRDWFADIVKIAQGLEALTRMGVGIPTDWIYARTGIPKPQDGESITEVMEKAIAERERGIDNKTKVPGGFKEVPAFSGKTDSIDFAEERRGLTYFEERGQLLDQEKVLDSLEADALVKGATILDTVFESVRDNIIKKISDQQGKQLAALPRFAVNVGKYKTLLTEAAFQYHATGFYFAKKEMEESGVEFAEGDVPLELGSIEESIKLFSKLIPRKKSLLEKIFKFYDERFFHIAGVTKKDIEKIFTNTLISLEDGWTLEDFKSVISNMKIQYTGIAYGKDQTGKPLKAHHLQVIHRNNMMKAYRDGRNELYNDPDVADFIWGYTYSAILDDRGDKRPFQHKKFNGITLPKEHKFWQRFDPPWDHGCRCLKFAVSHNDLLNGRAIMTPDERIPVVPLSVGWK